MSALPVAKHHPDAEHRFFVFDAMDGDHYYFKSAAERDQYAEYMIGNYMDDGWDESVEQVMAGELTHLAQQTNRVERPPADELDETGCDREGRSWQHGWEYYCDYELLPLATAPVPAERLPVTVTVDPWADDMLPAVQVKEGVLVIAVTTDALLHGITQGSGWPTDEAGNPVLIRDGLVMVQEVLNELQREDEQGTTAVHRLLDEAALDALNNGSQAIDYGDWVPA